MWLAVREGHEIQWIDEVAIFADLEVEMFARGLAGGASVTEDRTLAYSLALLHQNLLKVGIKTRNAITVLYNHVIAVACFGIAASKTNRPPRSGDNWGDGTVRQANVNAQGMLRSHIASDVTVCGPDEGISPGHRAEKRDGLNGGCREIQGFRELEGDNGLCRFELMPVFLKVIYKAVVIMIVIVDVVVIRCRSLSARSGSQNV